VGLRAGLGAVEMRKMLTYWESNPGSPTRMEGEIIVPISDLLRSMVTKPQQIILVIVYNGNITYQSEGMSTQTQKQQAQQKLGFCSVMYSGRFEKRRA
jgi:hypothetical protein